MNPQEGKGFEEAVEAALAVAEERTGCVASRREIIVCTRAAFEEALLSPAARKAAFDAAAKAQLSGRVYPSTAAVKAALATAKKASQEGSDDAS